MPYVPIAKEGQHIIQRALEAAEVIETVLMPNKNMEQYTYLISLIG